MEGGESARLGPVLATGNLSGDLRMKTTGNINRPPLSR